MVDEVISKGAPSRPDTGRRPPRRGPRRALLGGLAVALVAAGWAVSALVSHAGDTTAKSVPLGTATVRRTDFVSTESYRGTLSYPSRGTVHPGGGGTITSLPGDGDHLDRNRPLLSVDGRPVGVLFGATPIYRRLGFADTTDQRLAVRTARADLLAALARQEGVVAPAADRSGRAADTASSAAHDASIAQARVEVAEARHRFTEAERALRYAQAPQRGPDVALVAGNLASLGDYDGSTDMWSTALQAAVDEWQRRLGITGDGELDPSQVLVVRPGLRVSAVSGRPGDAASAVTISLSSSSREATFILRHGVPPALARGRRVRVSVGHALTATGHVASVTTQGKHSAVRVTFAHPARLAQVSATKVRMTITTAARRDVLAVPVQALLALASGGYAVQLPGGRLLAVHTGVVHDGDIEVSGEGIHAGLRVVSAT